jgi:neutral ceramidase
MRPLLAALLFCSLPSHAALRAGAAVADITPQEWPVRVIGGFTLVLADSAHDPLHARALVLEDGGAKVAFAVVDSCYLKRSTMDRAKQLASKRTGIAVSRILISATHTHSAPPSLAEKGNAKEERYEERIVTQTAEAIIQANAKLQPAKAGWTSRPVPEELFNRRWFMRPGSIAADPYGGTTDIVKMNPGAGSADLQHPAGTTDPEFSIVSIRSAAGKPLALLANYSLHYVGGVPGNTLSADYFGEFAKQTAARLAPNDPAFVAILTNGTSGDVNNNNFIRPRGRAEPFERIREVGTKMAGHAASLADSITYADSMPIRVAERELPLAFRKPTPEQLAFARKALEEPDEKKLPLRAKSYATRAIALHEGPAKADVKLQAIRLGSLGIAAIPAEVFTEIGLTIKELSPLRPTFTIELANGHYGYLPTPRHYALGGYETWLGTNNLEREASIKITRTLLELLAEVAR